MFKIWSLIQQNRALPLIMAGTNVSITTKQCDGKTLALVIAMVNAIDDTIHETQALCFVYTVVSAIGMKKFIEKITKHTEITVGLVCHSQKHDQAHIMIGTPLELSKYVNKMHLDTNENLKLVCIDDADVTSTYSDVIELTCKMQTCYAYCSSFYVDQIKNVEHINDIRDSAPFHQTKHYTWITDNKMKELIEILAVTTGQVLIFTEVILLYFLHHVFHLTLSFVVWY